MLNNFYRKVFQTAEQDFNPEKSFFTVYLNFAVDSEYNESLKNELAHYITPISRADYDIPVSDITENYLENLLRERASGQYGMGFDTCYVLIFDYCDNDITDKVNISFNTINNLISAGILGKNDKICTVVTLPDDNTAPAYIKSIEQTNIALRAPVYFFQKRKFFEQKLINNICSVVLLNGNKACYQTISSNVTGTDAFVETAVMSFPEAGRAVIKSHPATFWSSLSTFYNDDKMDFLRRYILNLFQNSVSFSDIEFPQICDDFFTQRLNINDTSTWVSRIQTAISRIPKKTNPATVKEEDYDLQNYYNIIYGYNGSDTVELTIKANLINFLSFNDLVDDAARYLFEYCSKYNNRNLCDSIQNELTSLTHYLAELNKTEYSALKNYKGTGVDIAATEAEYIRKYINYTIGVKKRAFWKQVYEYISVHRNDFAEQCEAARSLADFLDKSVSELSLSRNVPMGSLIFPKFTVLMIKECDSRVCEAINIAYNQLLTMGGASGGTPGYHDSFPELLCVNNNFIKDYTYEFNVNGTYTINVLQRIGKYFLFGEF